MPRSDGSDDDAFQAPEDAASQNIELACPRCGAALTDMAERCPTCGMALESAFYGTYRPAVSRGRRIIAVIVLSVCFLVPIGLFLWSLWAS